MSTNTVPPSFWSGVAAGVYYFPDPLDYSAWACGLLESGHDGPAIRILAGLFDEENLFALREWHGRCLTDLGLDGLGERAIYLAHLRGSAEDALNGRSTIEQLLESFEELYHEDRDEHLKPFMHLYLAYWHFEDFDSGFKNRREICEATRQSGLELVNRVAAEFDGLR